MATGDKDGQDGRSSASTDSLRTGKNLRKVSRFPDGCEHCGHFIRTTEKAYWSGFKPSVKKARQRHAHLQEVFHPIPDGQARLPGV